MRILHVITGLATGGAEIMLRKLLSATDRNRFSPHVLSLMSGGRVAEDIRALGIPVVELGMRRGFPSPTAMLLLARQVRALQPHLIQGWMYHGNLAAWLAWHLGGCNADLFWNIRQSLYELSQEKPVTRGVIRFCAHHANGVRAIIYNSTTSRQQHEAAGYPMERGLTIANGFETELFHPDAHASSRLRSHLGLAETVSLIGLVARYHPMKDHENFLLAASRLAAVRTDACFVLAGYGVDAGNADLLARLDALGLRHRVFLLGEVAEVAKLTSGFDVASSSSWSEAFPNAVGEAMSCGVPCVVTDVGDSAAIVGDTGWIVPPRDPEALAVAWNKALSIGSEARRALGERARARVLERYGMTAVVGNYEALYLSAMEKG